MKTVCVYHSIDLDGWISAAIVKHWFNGRGVKQHIERPNESITFIGYNYGQSIPDLSEYDKVIMCDISFPKEEMGKLLTSKNGNVIWIDHHISAINDNKDLMSTDNLYGLRDTKFAACELTWKYFFPNETMPEIVRLLGRYDCFGHKNTDEEQKVLEFQYGARQCISNYEEAYTWLSHSLKLTNWNYDLDSPENIIWEKGISIYQYLCTEAKQTYKNGFEIQFKLVLKDEEHTDCIYYNFIVINKERFNPINFGIDYHADGYDGAACFHYDGVRKVWTFSLYNDNGEVDCSAIAKQFGGGGHKGAAGFVTNDLNLIFNNNV